MTYRLGVHTTADDPTKYRSDEEVAMWEQKDPLTRFRALSREARICSTRASRQQVDEEIAAAVQRFEADAAAPIRSTMFDHVYAELPPDLAGPARREVAARDPARPAEPDPTRT